MTRASLDKRPAEVAAMFDGVAARYDRTNTILSFGQDPRWRRFNAFRSGTPVPGGESMLEAQARAIAELHRLRCRHPDGKVVIVSHGDVIKAIIAYHAGIAIDLMHRLEITPASVSVIDVSDHGARILGIDTAREWPGR